MRGELDDLHIDELVGVWGTGIWGTCRRDWLIKHANIHRVSKNWRGAIFRCLALDYGNLPSCFLPCLLWQWSLSDV